MDLSSSMIIPGLNGGHVDLVNWLVDQDNNGVQDFHEGAEETYWPSVQSVVGAKQRYWAPSEELNDKFVSRTDPLDDMDDCLAVNLSDAASLARLTGDDAVWARAVAKDYKELQQKRSRGTNFQKQQRVFGGDRHLYSQDEGQQQLFGDQYSTDFQQDTQLYGDFQQQKQFFDEFQQQKQLFDEDLYCKDDVQQDQIDVRYQQEDLLSSEPNVSPFESSYGSGSPFSPSGSGFTSSPNSDDLYSSLDYQESSSYSSPDYERLIDQQPEFIVADKLADYNNVSSIVAYENELNSSFKEEATLEIHPQDCDVIGDFVASIEEVYQQPEMKLEKNAETLTIASPVRRRMKIVEAGTDKQMVGSAVMTLSPHERPNDPSVIYCKRVNVNSPPVNEKMNNYFATDNNTLLKDIVGSNRGDDIMRELLSSPESTFSGSYDSSESVGGNYDSSESLDGSISPLNIGRVCGDFDESDDYYTSGRESAGLSGVPKRVPFTVTERKMRKKEQNKRAAIRYREKKKSELEVVSDIYHETLAKTKQLQEEKRKKFG